MDQTENAAAAAEQADQTERSEPIDLRTALEAAYRKLREAPEPEPAETAADKAEPEPDKKPDRAAARTPARNARGQFVGKKEKTDAPETATEAAPAPQQQKAEQAEQPEQTEQAEQAKETEAKTAPPPGWSVRSKAEWDKLPPHIRDDILKREREISEGFRQYEGLGRFAERARAAGQTLAEALAAYTGIEDLLRRDVGAGLLHIATNAGLTQYQAGQLFADLAQRLGHQFPAPGLSTAAGGSATDQNVAADPNLLHQVIAPVMQPLMQRINALEQSLRAQAEADHRQRERSATEAIEKFRTDPAHRYYENVEADIARLLESGAVPRSGNPYDDLAKAYEIACWQHPEIREQLINERMTKAEQQRKQEDSVERAKRASKSLNSSAAQGVSRPPIVADGADPIRAALEQAMQMVRGA